LSDLRQALRAPASPDVHIGWHEIVAHRWSGIARIVQSRTFQCVVLGIAVSVAAWIVTWNHGVAISPDSVSYIAAAERLAATGRLEVRVTEWFDPAEYAPLSHHAPLLPILLGVARRLTGAEVADLARVVNLVAVVVTAVSMGLATGGGVVSFLAVVGVLVTPTVFEVHVWLWTEPLFLALCCVAFVLLLRSIEEPSKGRLLLLGITCGAAALTRYAGVFLIPAVCAALLLKRPRLRNWLADIALVGMPFALLVGGWFLRLSSVGAPARRLDWYPGTLSQMAEQMPATLSMWAFPHVPHLLPPPIGASLVILGSGVLIWRAPPAGGHRLTAYAAALFFLAYLFTVVGARALADPSIPFDGRMLSPMAVFLGVAVGAAGALTRVRSIRGMAVFLAVALVFASQVNRSRRYLARGQNGIAYEASPYASAPWVASLADPSPETTVYSNDPFLLAALTGRPIKAAPHQREELTAFVAQVKATSPSVLVLVPDAHDMYVRRDDLLQQLSNRQEDSCPEVYLFEFAEGMSLPTRRCST